MAMIFDKLSRLKLTVFVIVALLSGGVYSLFFSKGSDRIEATSNPDSRLSNNALMRCENQPITKSETQLEAVSVTVRYVIDKEGRGLEKSEAVSRLGRNLSSADRVALMGFISADRPEGVRLRHWHALVDDIIVVLRRQYKSTQGLTECLVNLHVKSNDVVLKDYAIQHLGFWYSDRGGLDNYETNLDSRRLIMKTLIGAARQTSESYAGTALNVLDRIDRSQELRKEKIVDEQLTELLSELDSWALVAAESDVSHKLCRISALQVCANRNVRLSLPIARALAQSDQIDTSVRISAIAVIGSLGNESDNQLLENLGVANKRLANATIPALVKIKLNKK